MGQIELMIRFEDLNRDNDGSDDDLNDLIVSRDIGAATARQMIAASIASNIDLTDVDNAESSVRRSRSPRAIRKVTSPTCILKRQRNIGQSCRI